MIQMQLTSSGLAAVAGNSALTFTRFVAGSGTSNNETIAEACQDVPIVNSQTFIAGQSYTINGQPTVVDYNALELTGMMSTAQAQEAYSWTELALMARIGAGEEFAFAYGTAVNNAFYVDPADAVTYVLPFSVIFSDAPNVTVNTTEAGVPWATFLNHTAASVSDGAHGLRVSDGDLVVNGVAMGIASQAEMDARTTNVIGVNVLVDTLPVNVMDYVGVVAYNRGNQSCYRCQIAETIEVGDYVVLLDDNWQRCDEETEGSLLVIADGNTPGEGEIVWRDAQAHFCGWVSLDTVESRLQALEDSTSPYVKFKSADEREYNSEWVSRMTGAGTAASPYLIYTPYDFNAIRNDLTANYVLMNNLDFMDAIGIKLSLISGELVYGAINADAPLYNAGQGWEPFSEFKGVLNGNGNTLRGITCCRSLDYMGLCARINGAAISNLTIEDSIFVNSAARCWLGSLAGEAKSNMSRINNCINGATLYSSDLTNANWLGGLIGVESVMCNYSNCANHGIIKALNDSKAIIGGIVSTGNQNSVYTACYNSASLRGQDVFGIAYGSGRIVNCYNSGLIVGSNNSKSLTAGSSVSNSYSLAGCADTMQGTALTADQLKSSEAVDMLNLGLGLPVYVAVENGYPQFDFEALAGRSLSINLNLPVISDDGREVIPSGIDLGTLLHQPSREEFGALQDRVLGLETNRLVDSYEAYSAVLSNRIVSFYSDTDTYQHAESSNKKLLGVSKMDCSTGETGDVIVSGLAVVTAGEAVTAGDYLTGCTVDAVSGLAKPAADGDYIVGMALHSAAAGGDVQVMVSPGRLYQPKECCCADFVSGGVIIANRVVTVSNVGRVRAAGTTDVITGISTETIAKTGVLTRVVVSGVHQVGCSTNAITAGDYVGSATSAGFAVSVTASGRYYVGIALSDSADGYVNVLICPGRIP